MDGPQGIGHGAPCYVALNAQKSGAFDSGALCDRGFDSQPSEQVPRGEQALYGIRSLDGNGKYVTEWSAPSDTMKARRPAPMR